MKKAIMTSVALTAIGATLPGAHAQTVPAPSGAPTQGQSAYPSTGKSVATANNNNNSQAAAIPGPYQEQAWKNAMLTKAAADKMR